MKYTIFTIDTPHDSLSSSFSMSYKEISKQETLNHLMDNDAIFDLVRYDNIIIPCKIPIMGGAIIIE